MAITKIDSFIEFTSPDSAIPTLRHTLLACSESESNKIIAAVWEASKVPYVGKELGYFIYEEVAHSSKSEYHFWHFAGMAGCLLKSHLRLRIGAARTTKEILDSLTNQESTVVSA
jgi:hypothetical protein